jgi:hypothetical protein
MPARCSPSPIARRSAVIASRSLAMSAWASRFSTPFRSFSRIFFASSASFFRRSFWASSRASISASLMIFSSPATSASWIFSVPGAAACGAFGGGTGSHVM